MMKTIHRTTIVGRCPHGCDDVYEAEFRISDRIVVVESIQEAINESTADPIYQEELTQKLADLIGCEVATKGVHGPFCTECIANPRESAST
jgi:hypothetical protein